MEQDPPGIEPENESLEAGSSGVNPIAALRAKVDRLTRMGLLAQNALDEVACTMERCGVSRGLGARQWTWLSVPGWWGWACCRRMP